MTTMFKELNGKTRVLMEIDRSSLLDVYNQPLPFYEAARLLPGKKQSNPHPVGLQLYEADPTNYFHLLRQSTNPNILLAHGLYEDVQTHQKAIAFEIVHCTLESFFSQRAHPRMTTVLVQGEAINFSDLVIFILRGVARGMTSLHQIGKIHGPFSLDEIFLLINSTLPFSHPQYATPKLSLQTYKGGYTDFDGDILRYKKAEDWSFFGSLVETIRDHPSMNVEGNAEINDLVHGLKYNIRSLEAFFEKPSVWLQHQRVRVLLEVFESCQIRQFSHSSFEWRSSFPESYEDFQSKLVFVTDPRTKEREEITNTHFGFINWGKDIIEHFNDDLDQRIRKRYACDRDACLRMLQGHLPLFFNFLIVAAKKLPESHGRLNQMLKHIEFS